MYRSKTISKIIVMLLACSIPLQGISSAACGCNTPVKSACDTRGVSESTATSCTCCCQKAASSEKQNTQAHSCCKHIEKKVKPTCTCGVNCVCKKGESSPPKQAPTEHRTVTNDLTTDLPVAFTPESSDCETMERDGRTVRSISGADRCILLCRFHL